MTSSLANLELLTEHFGYPPLTFVDDVINTVNEIAYQATAGFERFVESSQGASTETEQAMHQVETLMESAIDHYFDMFELFVLRNIFNIPSGLQVALNHQKVLDLTVTEEREAQLNAEIKRQRLLLVASRYLYRKLKRNASLRDLRRQKVMGASSNLEFLVSEARKANVQPLDSTTLLIKDEITASYSCLNDLQSTIFFKGDEQSSIARIIEGNHITERTKYINHMVSRKVPSTTCLGSLSREFKKLSSIGKLDDLNQLEVLLAS